MNGSEVVLTMHTGLLVVYIAVLVIAIVDFSLVVFRGTGSSVSQWLITTAFKSPLVTMGFCVTVGHLFSMHDVRCVESWVSRGQDVAAGVALGWAVTYLILLVRQRRKNATSYEAGLNSILKRE